MNLNYRNTLTLMSTPENLSFPNRRMGSCSLYCNRLGSMFSRGRPSTLRLPLPSLQPRFSFGTWTGCRVGNSQSRFSNVLATSPKKQPQCHAKDFLLIPKFDPGIHSTYPTILNFSSGSQAKLCCP
uniref:Uncharacterized protein n=1 Tax=Cacopsylla melanoneura TaxID=428564 RepID=A0A8D9BG38_9HEMI